MVSRRQFITGCVTASTVAIAGCSSTPQTGGGPEAAVEQYFTAAQNGDIESANEVLHSESGQYPVDEGYLEGGDDFTLNSVNQVSPREIVEQQIEQNDRSGNNLTDEEIEEAVEGYEKLAEETIDEVGADDHAHIRMSFEQDGEEREIYIQAVQDDGDWYMFTP